MSAVPGARGRRSGQPTLAASADPTGLWSGDRALLSTGWGHGEAVRWQELAGLETLDARRGEVRDLCGLEAAAWLRYLDLGHNPLADLSPLAAMAQLRTLRLGGNALSGLQPLVWADVGGNRIEDFTPLDGLPGLTVASPDDRKPRSVSGGRSGSASRE